MADALPPPLEMSVVTSLRHRFVLGPDGAHPLPATVYCPRHGASRDVSECMDCPRMMDLCGDAMTCAVEGECARVAGALGREPAMCIAPDLPIARVYGELLRSVDLLPVVEIDATLVGVVGHHEIDGFSRLDGHRTIATVMRSARWLAIREDEPLDKVARHMARHRVRHLPVVDVLGRLVSILDDTRLLRAFAH